MAGTSFGLGEPATDQSIDELGPNGDVIEAQDMADSGATMLTKFTEGSVSVDRDRRP